jgi:hypothetical protein
MKRLAFAFVALMLSAPPLLAEDDGKIDASAFFHEDYCADGITSADCRLSFHIVGKMAETMFKAMKARAVKDECVEGLGKEEKSGLRCFKGGDGEYQCDFGYSFAKQSFDHSDVSC